MTDVKTMQKLNTARLEFLSKNVKKTGRNDYSKYDYFKLDDILTPILKICSDNKLFPQINFNHDEATLTIHDLEIPESSIVFNCPYDIACEVKGAQAIQNEGARQTYTRRYLYMVAFEISEPEIVEIQASIDLVEDDARKYRESILKQLAEFGLTTDKLIAYKGRLENIPTDYLEDQLKKRKEKAEKQATEEATNGQI